MKEDVRQLHKLGPICVLILIIFSNSKLEFCDEEKHLLSLWLDGL